MEAVKVQYTVQPEYVDQNKDNIRAVMEAIKANPIEGMLYSSYTIGEGNTFVHINIARDEDTLSKINDLPEFQAFRQQLKASGPISPPQGTKLNLVAAAFDL